MVTDLQSTSIWCPNDVISDQRKPCSPVAIKSETICPILKKKTESSPLSLAGAGRGGWWFHLIAIKTDAHGQRKAKKYIWGWLNVFKKSPIYTAILAGLKHKNDTNTANTSNFTYQLMILWIQLDPTFRPQNFTSDLICNFWHSIYHRMLSYFFLTVYQ